MKIYLKETDGLWKLYEVDVQAELDKRLITINPKASVGDWASVGNGASVGDGCGS